MALPVIPGREPLWRANPESRGPTPWLWIPGSLATLAPRNDDIWPQFASILTGNNRGAALGPNRADRLNWPPAATASSPSEARTKREALRDLFPADWKPKIKKLLLGFDARVDSGLFSGFTRLRDTYESFSTFMDRFHAAGWKRWLNELTSEAATIGTAGAILLLALAVPAFRETSDSDWLKKSELAVTFLDRYGNEVGTRGIRHNDSIPLDQFPDNLIKAVLATEDRRFYEHFGIDIAGTARAFVTNAQAPAAWCKAARR